MNKELIELLEVEYEELKLGFSKASIEGKGTPQEISDRREELFHSLLEKYFPFPYRITKGNIIDSYNNRRALTSKEEIGRALNQIKSVKELTRIRSGIIFDRDKTEYTYKIPSIIFAAQTYANIEKLIEKILEYYKENKIKRIYQFDILIAGDYTIINTCKGQITFSGIEKGIFFEKTGKKTLAILLFLMSNMPLVQPTMNEQIYNLYLDKVILQASYKDSWNKILEEIENS